MHGVHKCVYAWCKPRRSRQEPTIRHSLRSVFYFHHVLGILELASPLPHKCSRFFELTLLLIATVSVVMSTLPELQSLRGAGSTPEFLIFNDKVNGCEFLGKRDGTGGGGLFVEHHGGSGKPPEQTVTYTQRTLCGSLESAGLLQWLVFASVPKESPRYLPIPHIEEFLLTVCCFPRLSLSQVFTRLLAAELPPNDVGCP